MSAVVRLLGAAPVAGAWRLLTRGRLRAVTYHGVAGSTAFAAQLDWLGERFTTVTAGQVADALHGGAALPPRPVWLTFDDGDVTVVRNALPLLRERGMVATAFLCGAWLDSVELPWWVTLESAQREGLVQPADSGETDPLAVRLALKRMPDAQRRAVIAALVERLAAAGLTPEWPQWTTADGLAWLAAGNDLGNHSWDHPLLDRCDEAEQRYQVRAAHERLSNAFGRRCDVFAWPNGDPASAAADELRRLGYRLVAECDHRLAARRPDASALSRLKLDSEADPARASAVLSGGHSAVFHLQRRLRGRQGNDAVT